MSNSKANDDVAVLRREVRRLRIGLLSLGLAGAGAMMVAAAVPDPVLRTRGIVVTDGNGRDRIIIGAPTPASRDRTRQGAETVGITILGPDGADRLLLGQAPEPQVAGEVKRRIAEAWGLTFHDPAGHERGGIGFLGNDRAAVVLDSRDRDAIGMMVDDRQGFAGLIGMYADGKSAFSLSRQNGAATLTLTDPAGRERVTLNTNDR